MQSLSTGPRSRAQVRPPEKPLVYGRQSVANTKSIDDQLTIGRAEAVELTGAEPELFSDGSSAWRGRRRRDDWERVKAAVESKAGTWLWLWESSRGSRDTEEWMPFLRLCRDRAVLIHVGSHHRTYDMSNRRDWKSLAEDGIDAQDESWKISERTLRGIAHSASQGKPHGPAAFGYHRVYGPSGALLRQEPDEGIREGGALPGGGSWPGGWSPAGIVRQVFADARNGVSIRAIVADLNARGVPAPRLHAAIERGPGRRRAPGTKRQVRSLESWAGARWANNVVRDMLLNRSYLGERGHYDDAVADAWPPLIDAETFFAVQAIVTDPDRRTTTSPRVKHLLSCIAACGVCGGRVTCGGTQRLYRCDKGGHAAAPLSYADQAVTVWVLRWVAQPGRLDALREMEADDALRVARAEADALRVELAQWRAGLKDPRAKVSPLAFGVREAALIEALTEAESRATSASVYATVRAFPGSPDLAQATAVWEGLDLMARREVVRELADVRLFPAGRGKSTLKRTGELGPERLAVAARLENV